MSNTVGLGIVLECAINTTCTCLHILSLTDSPSHLHTLTPPLPHTCTPSLPHSYSQLVYLAVTGKGRQLHLLARHATLLRLFYGCLVSAPQITIHLYAIVIATGPEFAIFELSPTSNPLLAAIATSILSLAYTVLAFATSDRASGKKRRVILPAHISLTLWYFCTLTSRIIALALFAFTHGYFVFVVMGAHWFISLVLLLIQRTTFCSESSSARPEKKRYYLEIPFDVIAACVFQFAYFNAKRGKSRFMLLFYHVLVLVENAIMVSLFYIVHSSLSYSVAALTVVIGLYAVGIAFMVTYYLMFHPKKTTNWYWVGCPKKSGCCKSDNIETWNVNQNRNGSRNANVSISGPTLIRHNGFIPGHMLPSGMASEPTSGAGMGFNDIIGMEPDQDGNGDARTAHGRRANVTSLAIISPDSSNPNHDPQTPIHRTPSGSIPGFSDLHSQTNLSENEDTQGADTVIDTPLVFTPIDSLERRNTPRHLRSGAMDNFSHRTDDTDLRPDRSLTSEREMTPKSENSVPSVGAHSSQVDETAHDLQIHGNRKRKHGNEFAHIPAKSKSYHMRPTALEHHYFPKDHMTSQVTTPDQRSITPTLPTPTMSHDSGLDTPDKILAAPYPFGAGQPQPTDRIHPLTSQGSPEKPRKYLPYDSPDRGRKSLPQLAKQSPERSRKPFPKHVPPCYGPPSPRRSRGSDHHHHHPPPPPHIPPPTTFLPQHGTHGYDRNMSGQREGEIVSKRPPREQRTKAATITGGGGGAGGYNRSPYKARQRRATVPNKPSGATGYSTRSPERPRRSYRYPVSPERKQRAFEGSQSSSPERRRRQYEAASSRSVEPSRKVWGGNNSEHTQRRVTSYHKSPDPNFGRHGNAQQSGTGYQRNRSSSGGPSSMSRPSGMGYSKSPERNRATSYTSPRSLVRESAGKFPNTTSSPERHILDTTDSSALSRQQDDAPSSRQQEDRPRRQNKTREISILRPAANISPNRSILASHSTDPSGDSAMSFNRSKREHSSVSRSHSHHERSVSPPRMTRTTPQRHRSFNDPSDLDSLTTSLQPLHSLDSITGGGKVVRSKAVASASDAVKLEGIIGNGNELEPINGDGKKGLPMMPQPENKRMSAPTNVSTFGQHSSATAATSMPQRHSNPAAVRFATNSIMQRQSGRHETIMPPRERARRSMGSGPYIGSNPTPNFTATAVEQRQRRTAMLPQSPRMERVKPAIASSHLPSSYQHLQPPSRRTTYPEASYQEIGSQSQPSSATNFSTWSPRRRHRNYFFTPPTPRRNMQVPKPVFRSPQMSYTGAHSLPDPQAVYAQVNKAGKPRHKSLVVPPLFLGLGREAATNQFGHQHGGRFRKSSGGRILYVPSANSRQSTV